jgi:hypothetical protein
VLIPSIDDVEDGSSLRRGFLSPIPFTVSHKPSTRQITFTFALFENWNGSTIHNFSKSFMVDKKCVGLIADDVDELITVDKGWISFGGIV